MNQFFKSIIDQDTASVVICDLDHKIIYMNQSAIKNYHKRGGAALLGTSVMDCHKEESQEKIRQVVEWFKKSPQNDIIYIHHDDKHNKDDYMVALRDEERNLIGYYEKHEYRNPETCKRYDFT